MKKFKDIKIGDTVYVYGSSIESVEKFTVTYIEEFDINNPDINNPYNFYCIGYGKFGSKPKSYKDSVQSSCNLNDTCSTFGRYAATVYFNSEDVIKRFNEDINTLERYKQDFINEIENYETGR